MSDPLASLTLLAGLMRKELLALRRDPHSLAALFLMPLMFIVLMSLALQNLYNPPQPPANYAVLDRDGGGAARALQQRWMRDHGAPEPLPAAWQAPLRHGRLGYVMEIEPGFSRGVSDAAAPVPAPGDPQGHVRLHFEPGVSTATLLVTRATLERAVGELRARALLAEVAPLGLSGAGTRLSDSVTDRVLAQRLDAGIRPTAVQHNVPAWLVFGMFFVVAALGSLFVEERRCGALARLRGMGVGTGMLLAAKALPYLGVNLVQAAVMLSAGLWLMPVLGVQGLSLQGVSLPALGLVLLASSLAAVGLGLWLATLMRTSAQAHAVGPLANVLMGAVGGIMVPTFVMPTSMQTLARLSPMNWALEALMTVLVRGGGVAQVGMQLLPLLALSLITLLCAAHTLRRRPALP